MTFKKSTYSRLFAGAVVFLLKDDANIWKCGKMLQEKYEMSIEYLSSFYYYRLIRMLGNFRLKSTSEVPYLTISVQRLHSSKAQRCKDFWKPSIVCLTRVWQSRLTLFCDRTFEFAIQTWQTSLEHYYVYVQTYCLSQLRKMLILLIIVSIVKCAHCRHYDLSCLAVANNTNTRDRIEQFSIK